MTQITYSEHRNSLITLRKKIFEPCRDIQTSTHYAVISKFISMYYHEKKEFKRKH